MGVPSAPALWAVLASLGGGLRDPAGSWPPSEAACRQSCERERGFLEDPALGLAPAACWGSAEWGDGGPLSTAPTHRPQRLRSLFFVGGGGLGRNALCLGSAGAQWGSRGPLVGCSQAPSLQAPPLPQESVAQPLPARGTPREEVTQHKGAADLFSFALPSPHPGYPLKG